MITGGIYLTLSNKIDVKYIIWPTAFQAISNMVTLFVKTLFATERCMGFVESGL